MFKKLSLVLFLVFQSLSSYSAPCSQDEISFLSFGDYLLHGRLQDLALTKKDYSWFLSSLSPLLQQVDFKTLNLEGPVASGVSKLGEQKEQVNYFDNEVLSSYPMFNYHTKTLDSIKALGFDILTTANNHSLDRRSLGVDKTIEALNERQLNFVGTRVKNDDSVQAFFKVVTVKGFKIAMISCTEHTNGIPDKHNQVLYCGKDLKLILSLIKESKADRTINGVMVFPHWGEENEFEPRDHQKNLARKFIEAGSFAVIGSHPHVIQTMESYQASNGNKGFVFYSLGNLVSGQVKLAQRSTLGLLLKLGLNQANELEVKKVAYIPLYMDRSKLQVIPIENEEVPSKKKTLRAAEMQQAEQLLSVNLGTQNKLYFNKAVELLRSCQF